MFGSAQAVSVNPDGRGEVLIYPYYTTRADGAGNAYTTLLSVVNPTASGKAVKVRFLEGRNSRAVLDFNVFLSPFDTWTGAVLPDVDSGGAKVGTLDQSCTLPSFSGSPTAPFISFGNLAYTGNSDDGGGATRSPRKATSRIIGVTYSSSSITGAISHVSRVPPCGANLNDTQQLRTLCRWRVGYWLCDPDQRQLRHRLHGRADGITGFMDRRQLFRSWRQAPDLASASPHERSRGPGGRRYESFWGAGGADPVSAVLMHDGVLNGLRWTPRRSQVPISPDPAHKRCVGKDGQCAATVSTQLQFEHRSCDDVTLKIWDREAYSDRPINFSPPPPTPGVQSVGQRT